MEGVVLGVTLLVLAVVFQMMNRQVQAGNLGNNGAFGILTMATRSSEAAWQAGHLAAVPAIRIAYRLAYAWFAVVLVVAIVLQATVKTSPVPFVLAAIGLIIVLGVTLRAAVTADRAAKQVRSQAGQRVSHLASGSSAVGQRCQPATANRLVATFPIRPSGRQLANDMAEVGSAHSSHSCQREFVST